MTIRKILYRKNGENIGTAPDAFKPYNEETDAHLLSVMDNFCFSYDDNRLVPAHKYELHELDLPVWLSTEDYCYNEYRWRFILAYPDMCEKLGAQSYRLLRMDFDRIKALAELFKVKKFRSSFRQSIFSQVCEWFNDPDPRYRDPLSPGQWNAISRFIR